MNRQRLQIQTLLCLGLALLITMSIGASVSHWILSKNISEYESRSIQARFDSASLLINEQTALLSKFAADYGLWDETYGYMLADNKKYVSTTYTYEAIRNIGADFILLINADQRIKLSASLSEFARQKPGEVLFAAPNPTIERLLQQLPAKTTQPSASLYFLNGQAFVLATAPITRSDGSGTPRGTVVMGRQITAERLKLMQQLSGAPFELSPANGKPSAIEFDSTQFSARRLIQAATPYLLTLYGERPLLNQRNTALQLIGSNLALVWLSSLILVMLILGRLVIRRLEQHSLQLKQIRETQNAGTRLISNQRDEIDQVATAVNELLDEIDLQQHRLVHEACHDSLTGLGNRTRLAEQLRLALSLLRRKIQQSFCFMLIDLDGFKHINDVYGHPAGDFLLIKLSNRISETIRETDCAVRLGGDEFAILLMGVNQLEHAVETAERLRHLLSEPVLYNEMHLNVSGSIGLIFVDQALGEHVTPDDLMKQADIAMYQAKNAGRDKVTVFDKKMEAALLEYVQLEHDLRDSIAHEMLDICFQPIFSLDGRKIESLEVLGRWFHPQFGLISPERFIPIAENAHLIRQYSLGMIRKACLIARMNFSIMPELRLSVNISVQEMLEDAFFDDLHYTLMSVDFPPHHLNLEITESLLAQNETELIGPMQRCREIGITFHIDDFGTGYSSLARLHSLPISMLKIDKSFIRRIGHGGDGLVCAMIDMAHNLNMRVISEGVETRQQLSCLEAAGCDFIQGYLYGRPMAVSEFSHWLQTHQIEHNTVAMH